MRLEAIVLNALLLLAAACEGQPQKNAFDQGPDQAKPIPKTSAVPEPSGPPEFEIDTISAKVGFERTMTDSAEGMEKLRSVLSDNREHVQDKDLVVRVDRKAKVPWVVSTLGALYKAGAKSARIRTESREGYPAELVFLSQSEAANAPRCSAVAIILDDRSTAVWKLSGGTASRRQKGMAGPDLSMTGETLERVGKQCKESELLFVSAAETVEWGLVYDLAASSQRLDKFKYERMVLLDESPTPGHPIEL